MSSSILTTPPASHPDALQDELYINRNRKGMEEAKEVKSVYSFDP